VPDVAASANDGMVGKILERYGAEIDRALDSWTALRARFHRKPKR
jgi:hypothetical protein